MSLPRGGTRGFPPAVVSVLALGLALSIAQQFAIRDEVFVSGDSGIKALVAKQFARGDWHADLRLPAEPWVQELWRDGLYPFGPPFAYEREGRWFIQYPLPFMVLTAPFFEWFGFRGLTMVPLLGLWLLWLSMASILRSLGASASASAISIGGLAFCSFVTPYGAMYWEHTLALGLSFFGFSVLVSENAAAGRSLHHFAGGALLGCAVWFRPESACFAVGIFVALVLLRRKLRLCLSACLGVGLPCLIFAGLNLWLYGTALGAHAIQQVDPSTLYVAHSSAYEITAYFVNQLFKLCPVVSVLIVCAVVGIDSPALRIDRTQAMLWGIVIIFCLGTALAVPNSGGKQLGARYFLHALPAIFLLLGLVWDRAADLAPRGRRGLRAAIAIGLLAGLYLNAARGTQALFLDYRDRTLPALLALREDSTRVVAVEHQQMAQELESAFDDKIFFRVRNRTEFGNLARAMLERDEPRFTLVQYGESEEDIIDVAGLRVQMHPRGRFGLYGLVDCVVEPAWPRITLKTPPSRPMRWTIGESR
jgi:hypothetical protein